MDDARHLHRAPAGLLVLAMSSMLGLGEARGQSSAGAPAHASHGPIQPAYGAVIAQAPANQAPAPRGPLARLVPNPNSAGGLPPFALTDQAGTIQRYVEPVPGIDLSPYVGQVVIVRHDTGRILLASQLELPDLLLAPLAGERPQSPVPNGPLALHPPSTVRAIQYADDDDTTVELLGNDASPADELAEELPELPASVRSPRGLEDRPFPGGGYQPHPAAMSGLPAGDHVGYGLDACECYPPECNPMMPCPHCGRMHGLGHPCAADRRTNCLYGEVEINMLRAHANEEAVGKLSEKYEFSPRFILGFRELGPLDGRIRYWIYGRDTPILAAGDFRLEFDVVDFEATHAFNGRRSELLLSAGLRLAHIELGDDDGDRAGTDLTGLTMAIDGRTRLLDHREGILSWIYGGRLSILAGNWGGEPGHDFIAGQIRDDNALARELHVGLEYACCYRSLDLYARAAFEMQNWHSDVLSDRAGFGSIGMIGPGLRVGAGF